MRKPGPAQHPTFRSHGATVQGNAITAGLMLTWACDLIVAADDAKFCDVVGVRMGMPGVEYYAHPWEFGPRNAKGLLLTGDSIDADEAYHLGGVEDLPPRRTRGQDTRIRAPHRRAADHGGLQGDISTHCV
jgi:enoyl-CoA hydratase